MLRRWLLVTACCCVVGCSDGERTARDPDEFDLYEAVLRRLASVPPTDSKGARVVCYVSLGGEDLPEGLWARFRGHSPSVEPASRYRADNRAIAAHIVSIRREVQWLDADHPQVFVLTYPAAEPPKCGTPYPVALRRHEGRWVVVDQ